MNMPPSPPANKPRALGRGLDALLPSAPAPRADYGDKSVFLCPVEKITPQKGQPRQHFDVEALDELAASIRQHGVIEPLVVRRLAGSDMFELIAGERRWRASQRAGLREVMVVVKDVSSDKAFVLAILENVQREDLNPVELAEAYGRLVKEHGYTHETLAAQIGKSRTAVTNALRLLKLPERVREKLMVGELTEGHARALLGASEAQIEELAEKVLRGRLNVRDTEKLVKALSTKGKAQPAAAGAKGEPVSSAAIRDLESRLTQSVGCRVHVRDAGNKGEVVIPYADLDALDRLIARLTGE